MSEYVTTFGVYFSDLPVNPVSKGKAAKGSEILKNRHSHHSSTSKSEEINKAENNIEGRLVKI